MGRCECERVGDAWVVRLRGQFYTDEDADLILRSLTGFPDGARCVVINWEKVEGMNSLSFGALYRGCQEMGARGVAYRNCTFSARIRAVVPHIKWLFDWHYTDTESEALQACAQPAAEPRSDEAR
jgi:anti-anti-sigma regulatory factor